MAPWPSPLSPWWRSRATFTPPRRSGPPVWTGIAQRRLGEPVVETLMRNDMFSGWGIRTLSATSSRFNPLGYHLGTVWPHDNSLIALGVQKHGFEEKLNEM